MPTQKRPAKTPRDARARDARRRARETSQTPPPTKIKTERVAAKIASDEADAARPRPTKEIAARPQPTARARPTKTGRPTTVAIVGVGRLGSALALALDSCGYAVSALVSRDGARARRAARSLTNSRPLALSAAQLDRLPDTDLLIIATPDDQIEATAARVSASLDERAAARQFGADAEAAATRSSRRASSQSSSRSRRATRVALHASGALSSRALAPLGARGFATGSLHPLVSVSDPQSAVENLRGAFYCVEGDAPATRLARRVVRSLGGRAFSVRARDKALYHAAAVLAAGHAVALFDLATESLAACGLTRKRARAVLLPLARSAVANLASARSNAAALTGPFARADAATVRRNLSAFDRAGLRGVKAVYELLGLASLDLAEQSGADPASLEEIARALSEADAGEDA